jgi:hypothetical protein
MVTIEPAERQFQTARKAKEIPHLPTPPKILIAEYVVSE